MSVCNILRVITNGIGSFSNRLFTNGYIYLELKNVFISFLDYILPFVANGHPKDVI